VAIAGVAGGAVGGVGGGELPQPTARAITTDDALRIPRY
jgi:hypothetical protein